VINQIPIELIDDIRTGECLPVIGAGFSLNALLPLGCKMPLWNDLGIEVAGRMRRPYSGNALTTLTEYCCNPGKKHDLMKLLRKSLYIGIARPGEAHQEFAKLPFHQILTTNFDFLLERAYDSEGKSYLPVVDGELLPFGRPDGETRIVKMHGDLHHPSVMVVTEEDYDGFRDLRWDMFLEVTSLLKSHSLLFVGYSIDDPDFRQIWNLVKIHLGKLRRPAYALVVDATREQVDTYERRGITEVVSLPNSGSTYGQILAEAFREIHNAIKVK
jgi:hypothetical protein